MMKIVASAGSCRGFGRHRRQPQRRMGFTRFETAGVQYTRADRPKSALYLEALPTFNRGAVSIPDMPVLLRELRLLERRKHRSGKDSVDPGTGGSDDSIVETSRVRPEEAIRGEIKWQVITADLLAGTFEVTAGNSAGQSKALRRD